MKHPICNDPGSESNLLMNKNIIHMCHFQVMELNKLENQTLPSITSSADGRKWWANFEFYPDVVTNRKSIFRGLMYSGENYYSQTECAVKFGEPDVNEEELIKYVEGIREIHRLAGLFNATQKGVKITVLLPCVAVMDKVAPFYNRVFRMMQKNYTRIIADDDCILLEEWVQGHYVPFVDPEGNPNSVCPDVVHQFAHFCHHETKGQLVVTNLQGIEKDNGIILSSPVVHSVERKYGQRDKGMTGMATFFERFNNACSEGCKQYLSNKDIAYPSYPPSVHSTEKEAQLIANNTIKISEPPSYSASEAQNVQNSPPPPYDETPASSISPPNQTYFHPFNTRTNKEIQII